ncbi:MAG: hypothetical protein MUF18_17115 [Fimbriiglobus sp.]|nr:hypothetical protein [Fimbriiglobus sp.]
MRTRTTFGGLNLQTLEARENPSGNVTATLIGGQLKIEGDDFANDIRVSQTSTAVTVAGRNGTLVNGVASVRFAAANLQQAEIKMNGGNDVVAIARLVTGGDQVIELGDGNDRINLNGDVTGTLVAVIGGQGDDTVTGTNLTSGGDMNFQLEDGVGRVTLNTATLLKSLTISTKDGADVISATGLSVGEDFAIETALGNDRVSLSGVSVGRGFTLNTDLGVDVVSMANFSAANADIQTGDGNDTVTLSGVNILENITVNTDAGNDTVTAHLRWSGNSRAVRLRGVGESGRLPDTPPSFVVKRAVQWQEYRIGGPFTAILLSRVPPP